MKINKKKGNISALKSLKSTYKPNPKSKKYTKVAGVETKRAVLNLILIGKSKTIKTDTIMANIDGKITIR